MTRTNPSSGTVSSPGVALVVTLMMMSVLVMMVMGLAGVMRNEQSAARNLTYQVLAEQLAEVGARQGMTAVLTSTPAAGQMTATGPGWILAGNTTRYLFSPASSAQDVKNLERIGTNSLILGLPAGVRGSIYAGWSNISLPNPSANTPIGRYAWWVDDEGTKLNLNAVGSNNTNLFLPLLTNFPFSADWVFVDPATGQTNATNAAQAQALRSRLQWLPTPEALKGSNFLNVIGGINNLLREEDYHRIKGHVTTWSSNADLTPWGSQKLNLADPALTAAQIKAMLTTNVWTNVSGGNLTLARKYGGGITDTTNPGSFGDTIMNFIAADLQSMCGQPAAPTLNTNNPGNLSIFRHRFRLPLAPVGNQYSNTPTQRGLHPYLTEVMASVDSFAGGSSITVTLYLQIEVFNPWGFDLPANNFQLSILPRKFRFHVTTGNKDAVPTVTGPPNFLTVTGTIWSDGDGVDPLLGLTGTLGCWAGPMIEDGNPWPIDSPITRNVPELPARSHTIVSVPLVWTLLFNGVNPVRVDQAYVMLDRVILESVGNTALDWVSLDDFSQGPNYGFGPAFYTRFAADIGQMAFNRATAVYPAARRGTAYNRVGPTQNQGAFSPADAQGLGKYDPRVRLPNSVWIEGALGAFFNNTYPVDWRAWYAVGSGVIAPLPRVTPPVSPGNPNNALYSSLVNTLAGATGVTGLGADPGTVGLVDLRDHPHFQPGYIPINGFRSIAHIGAAHAGIPWRTLRLQPTPSAELAQGPPDWILLDAFTATNATTALPRVNLNGLAISLQGPNSTAPGAPVNSANQIQARPWPLLGTMGALRTNLPSTNTNAFLSNGVVVSMVTNTNAILSSGRFLQIASSLSNVLSAPNQAGSGWAGGSGWAAYRAALSSNYPPNGFALVGEVLETSQLAHDGGTVGEDIVEGRLRGFLDMLTTRSDTFSVWSIGQGLVVVTNAGGNPIRTNVMGEVRKQTVFQRIPQFNAVGNVTGYQLQVLYTRNHVVE